MPNAVRTEQVSVSIVSATVDLAPPAWHLVYEVCNLGRTEIWLIVGESLVLRRDGPRIELSYARGKMQPGVHVFGYFDPEVTTIPPGKNIQQLADITWPCHLSAIWNAEPEPAPPPGAYDVSVRIGYALTPAPEAPEIGEGVEAPVLNWQREATSPSIQIVIPPYTQAPG